MDTSTARNPSAVRLSERRSVDRPRPGAFDYTADFANIMDWDPGVVASRRRSPGPVAVGSTFDVEVRYGRGTLEMVYEIVELDPGTRVVLRGRGDGLDAVDEIRFTATEGGIVIDYTADLTFHGPVRFLRPLLPLVLRRVGQRAADGLAAAVST